MVGFLPSNEIFVINCGQTKQTSQYIEVDSPCETVHITVVCMNENAPIFIEMLKSVLHNRRDPLHFHIIVNNSTESQLKKFLRNFDLPDVKLSYYNAELKLSKLSWIPTYQHSEAYLYMKLLIPDLLPKNLQKVLVLDTDVTVLIDIYDLWKIFSDMNNEQILGLAEEQGDRYLYDDTNKYVLGKGYNTRVMLLFLNKIPNSYWTILWREALQYALIHRDGPVSEVLGDQEIINALVFLNPQLVYNIDCHYNVQLRNGGHKNTVRSCYEDDFGFVKIVNWNFADKHRSLIPDARYFRNIHEKYTKKHLSTFQSMLPLCHVVSTTSIITPAIDTTSGKPGRQRKRRLGRITGTRANYSLSHLLNLTNEKKKVRKEENKPGNVETKDAIIANSSLHLNLSLSKNMTSSSALKYEIGDNITVDYNASSKHVLSNGSDANLTTKLNGNIKQKKDQNDSNISVANNFKPQNVGNPELKNEMKEQEKEQKDSNTIESNNPILLLRNQNNAELTKEPNKQKEERRESNAIIPHYFIPVPLNEIDGKLTAKTKEQENEQNESNRNIPNYFIPVYLNISEVELMKDPSEKREKQTESTAIIENYSYNESNTDLSKENGLETTNTVLATRSVPLLLNVPKKVRKQRKEPETETPSLMSKTNFLRAAKKEELEQIISKVLTNQNKQKSDQDTIMAMANDMKKSDARLRDAKKGDQSESSTITSNYNLQLDNNNKKTDRRRIKVNISPYIDLTSKLIDRKKEVIKSTTIASEISLPLLLTWRNDHFSTKPSNDYKDEAAIETTDTSLPLFLTKTDKELSFRKSKRIQPTSGISLPHFRTLSDENLLANLNKREETTTEISLPLLLTWSQEDLSAKQTKRKVKREGVTSNISLPVTGIDYDLPIERSKGIKKREVTTNISLPLFVTGSDYDLPFEQSKLKNKREEDTTDISLSLFVTGINDEFYTDQNKRKHKQEEVTTDISLPLFLTESDDNWYNDLSELKNERGEVTTDVYLPLFLTGIDDILYIERNNRVEITTDISLPLSFTGSDDDVSTKPNKRKKKREKVDTNIFLRHLSCSDKDFSTKQRRRKKKREKSTTEKSLPLFLSESDDNISTKLKKRKKKREKSTTDNPLPHVTENDMDLSTKKRRRKKKLKEHSTSEPLLLTKPRKRKKKRAKSTTDISPLLLTWSHEDSFTKQNRWKKKREETTIDIISF